MPKTARSNYRFSEDAKRILRELAAERGGETAALEELLYDAEHSRVEYGRRVWGVTARLIGAVQSGDEAAIGSAQMALAELLHSLPAATGIAGAIREGLDGRLARD